ncbi:MAG TPA: argininosuccinate synthase [Euryarchaeota archaeon]|nr:argininosuccinate synthase [Euryarchaeota archaeon]
MDKVVLAYSGGLDTSVCVKILQEEYGFEVVTVSVDVGITAAELREAEEKARSLGAKHYTVDAKKEFIEGYVFKSIRANGVYEGYPLSTALARPLIAAKVVEIAKAEGASALAHGATGKGNDQFRFESVFRTMAPEMKIIAPIRERNMTRDESVAYAGKYNIQIGAKKPYSIDENLWGRSIEGGVLEDPGSVAPEEIFQWTKQTKTGAENIEIRFENGVPIEINGETLESSSLVAKLNLIAGAHGVGRIDIIEDRILGIKARENYECPAAVVLLAAHRDLERLVLTRAELEFKESVDSRWADLVYKGLWNEPLRQGLDAFIDMGQHRVSGTVKVELKTGAAKILARSSPYSLYSEEAASFDDTSIDQRDAEGMLKYHALQAGLYNRLKRK